MAKIRGVKDEIGKRMKEYYENRAKNYLVRNMPVIIRVDGNAFHTLTRNMVKPFDTILMETMQETMVEMCKEIGGCVLGYTQSDEISLLLVDYKTTKTDAWYNYSVQKLASRAASKATNKFNKIFEKKAEKAIIEGELDEKVLKAYKKAIDKGAEFDGRCFNIPKEEVTNYFYWRQLDASTNSVAMLAQSQFSHKELHKKSWSDMQDMLMIERGINWSKIDTYKKRGACCKKVIKIITGKSGQKSERNVWELDLDIPEFKADNRIYIEETFNIY